MASLALGLAGLDSEVLVLESDLLYEPRALAAIVESRAVDVTLLSGPTGAGDEVWVWAPAGQLKAMSKSRGDLTGVTGEFVGITRLSLAAAKAMQREYDAFVQETGHRRMDYETNAMVAVARARPVCTLLLPDLCWGELDDERHLQRITRDVVPRLQQAEKRRLT
jgi:2-aminoethylphosphonate-pyruvate transaminase